MPIFLIVMISLRRLTLLQFLDLAIIQYTSDNFRNQPSHFNHQEDFWEGMVTCSGLERKLPCTVTPEPMLTRSSDWVEFALIYENNLDSVKNISEELDAYGPFSIKKGQVLIQSARLLAYFAFNQGNVLSFSRILTWKKPAFQLKTIK